MILERQLWTIRRAVRAPRSTYHNWRKWRNRPAIGDLVEDCRGEFHRVARFGGSADDLILDDGHAASWMHCCDQVRTRHGTPVCPQCGRIISGIRCTTDHWKTGENAS